MSKSSWRVAQASDMKAVTDHAVLVTGSSGYLGYALAQRLSERYAVVGFDRRAPSHPPPTAECLYVDLTSEPSLRRGLETIRELHGNVIASVVHLAAYYDFSGAPSPLYEKVTVRGTARLLRMLHEAGFHVEQFIFASTMLVHAPTSPGHPISESSPLQPTWPYPQSKVRTEEAIREHRDGIPTVVLRIAGVYDDLGHSAPLPRQVQRIFEHDPTAYVFPGDLSHGQAMVHRDDVVDLYVRLVERRAELPPELVLEVGEPETPGYGDLQVLLGRLIHGQDWRTVQIPKTPAKAGAWLQDNLPLGRTPFVKPWMIARADDHYELDISRARATAGWEPKHRLRETIPGIVAALKADPWTWYRENELMMPAWLAEVAPQAPTKDVSSERLEELGDLVAGMGSGGSPSVRGATESAPDSSRHGDHSQTQDGASHSRAEPAASPGEHTHGERGAGHASGQHGPSQAQADIEHLQEMRLLQAVLEQERSRELADQRRHDAEAQRLMDTDPQGHIEMMQPLQERRALLRELPSALLEHEAALAKAAERSRTSRPGVADLGAGLLMAWHVAAEHWAHIAVMPLGAWLIFSPAAFAYGSAAMAWSDIISGLLVIALAALSMGRRPWAPWANAAVGLWVAFAPLAFSAPTPAAYASDTLIGSLIVALSVIVPMRTEMPGPDVPPGWTYSPSTWAQRAPVIVLALLSFFLSRYMASFQLGYISSVWDPLFGRGTELVLTSSVSQAFPVSDAGLGAYVYLVEFLSALMGDARRWRTMPWMVALFGLAVVPLGIASTVLIMLQPVSVGAWCSICLLTALFMLIMVALSLDEVVAMIQFLIAGRRAGASAWRLFWTGGTLPATADEVGLTRRPAAALVEMLWGVSLSWTLLPSALVGAWVMAAPWVFGTTGPAFTFESVFGALAIVVAFVAWAEVTRAARFANVLIGLAIAAAVWFFPDVTLAARLNDLLAGILLIALAVPRGPVHNRYAAWDRFIL